MLLYSFQAAPRTFYPGLFYSILTRMHTNLSAVCRRVMLRSEELVQAILLAIEVDRLHVAILHTVCGVIGQENGYKASVGAGRALPTSCWCEVIAPLILNAAIIVLQVLHAHTMIQGSRLSSPHCGERMLRMIDILRMEIETHRIVACELLLGLCTLQNFVRCPVVICVALFARRTFFLSLLVVLLCAKGPENWPYLPTLLEL